MPKATDLNSALSLREQQRIRNVSGVVQETRSSGTVTCEYGESLIDIPFAVEFLGPPAITFGGELFPNTILKPGHYPEVIATVFAFDVRNAGEIGASWVGAKLTVIVRGDKSTKAFLHYTATGKAFSNPTRV